MLFAELRSSLKTEIKPCYILFGSDIFLIDKSIELILAAAEIAPMNVIRLDSTATENDIQATASNTSMFGDKTAVVVRGDQETRVILEKGAGERVDCNPMSTELVMRLIMQDKKFTFDAANLLAQCCENNYARVDNELNKLTNYFNDKDKITSEDVSSIVTKTENYQIYELSNMLLKRDARGANKILQVLIESGVDEYAIFSSLVSSARRLFYSLTTSQPDAIVAGYLKVNPYAIKASRRDGRHLSERISEIYKTALDLEYQIKSGKLLTNRAVVLLMGALL